MTKHVKMICTKKHDDGGEAHCNICDLFLCSVCGGAEGSLTTDCPGVNMNTETADAVYGGFLDFREGRGWVTPDGTGSSMGDMDIKFPRRTP